LRRRESRVCYAVILAATEKLPVILVGVPIFHLCGYYGIDLEKLIVEKMDYNQRRPYRHGGKKA
jgi:hypothetical protein